MAGDPTDIILPEAMKIRAMEMFEMLKSIKDEWDICYAQYRDRMLPYIQIQEKPALENFAGISNIFARIKASIISNEVIRASDAKALIEWESSEKPEALFEFTMSIQNTYAPLKAQYETRGVNIDEDRVLTQGHMNQLVNSPRMTKAFANELAGSIKKLYPTLATVAPTGRIQTV